MSLFGKITHAVSHVAHMAEHQIHAAVAVQAHALAAGFQIVTGHPQKALEQLQKGAKEIADDPTFKMALPYARYVPGLGPGISAGMHAVQAMGEHKSLTDSVLAGARDAVPPGPATTAFDLGVGVAHHGFSPAAMMAIRDKVPGGNLGLAAFDSALAVAHGHHPDLHNAIASAMPPGARKLLDRVQAAGRAARRPMNLSHGMPPDIQRAVDAVLARQGKRSLAHM